mgnify:CR=1 FL=1
MENTDNTEQGPCSPSRWLKTLFYRYIVVFVWGLLSLTCIVYVVFDELHSVAAMAMLTAGVAVLAQSAITSRHLEMIESGETRGLTKAKRDGTSLRIIILLGTVLATAAAFMAS